MKLMEDNCVRIGKQVEPGLQADTNNIRIRIRFVGIVSVSAVSAVFCCIRVYLYLLYLQHLDSILANFWPFFGQFRAIFCKFYLYVSAGLGICVYLYLQITGIGWYLLYLLG